MQVLLKESVEHLGEVGDLVDVKDGYGRNYLVPKGFATIVTRKNRKSIETEIAVHTSRKEAELEVLREEAKTISEAKCTVAVKADENDKLYGSVTQEEVAKSLAISGIKIDPRKISIPKQIKSIGVFDVRVKLHKEISADLKVWVVKE
jgi:large subunit ribosomal protein L9